MANEIKLTFAGDARPLTKAFDDVGRGAKDMGDDLVSAEKDAGRFSGGIGSMNEKIDASESKFTGAADLVDGLAGAFGVSLGPVGEYAQSFASLAGGFTSLLGPALEGAAGKISKLSVVTKLQTAAQAAMNAVMAANPVLLVVLAIAALVAIFVVAYKKVGWFHDGVNAAFGGIKAAGKAVADWFVGFGTTIKDTVTDAAKMIGKVADIITTPYQIAFRAIAHLWNSTVGALEVNIPGFLGFGGIHFGVPDIPELANGGTARGGMPHLVGERGPELFVPGQTGTVVPNGALGGGATVVFSTSGDPLWEAIKKQIRVRGGTGPDSVQRALGTV